MVCDMWDRHWMVIYWKEGDHIRFTRTKDNKTVYAFSLTWPGRELVLTSVRAEEGSRVRMLGVESPLSWRSMERGLVIEIPEYLRDEANRPCKEVWGFRIDGAGRAKV